jgi:hypothetical protein
MDFFGVCRTANAALETRILYTKKFVNRTVWVNFLKRDLSKSRRKEICFQPVCVGDRRGEAMAQRVTIRIDIAGRFRLSSYPAGPLSASPSQFGFLAVPSKAFVVLNPSNLPREAASAVRASRSATCFSVKGRKVLTAWRSCLRISRVSIPVMPPTVNGAVTLFPFGATCISCFGPYLCTDFLNPLGGFSVRRSA